MSRNLVKFDAIEFSVDAYTEGVEAEFAAEFSIDNYTAAVEAEFLQAFFNNDEDADESIADDEAGGRKKRSPNAFEYKFGNVYEANWYKRFLCDSVRERTYYLSQRDRYGEFRSLFRMPLTKIDDIVSLFIEKGWVYQTKHCKCEKEMTIKLELRILGALKVIGHNAPFRTLQSDTNISDKEHRNFFKTFIDCMFSIKDDFICYPTTQQDLNEVMGPYADNYLPGCGGSIDVVHVKWSNCPAEDVNRAKGKEGFPSLAFEVVTGFDRQILGVSIAHFGTRNDKQIVCSDETIQLLRNGWYRDVEWTVSDAQGNPSSESGVYLICDGGYIRWPELICPYKHEPVSSQKGFFFCKNRKCEKRCGVCLRHHKEEVEDSRLRDPISRHEVR